jgi:hypothetical protein
MIDGRKWSFEGREYLVGMHDFTKQVGVFKCGRQVGKTQTWMNRGFHRLQNRGWSAMAVFPTADEVGDFSADRFKPAYDSSPALQKLFLNVDNVHHKQTVGHWVGAHYVPGGNVYLRGSKAKSKLQSVPVQQLFFDEYDFCVVENLGFAEECVSGHVEWEQLICSTPSVPDYGIEKEWARSDQAHYFLRCPHCREVHFLEWPDSIEWVEGKPESARYRCKKCKRAWKWEVLRRLIREASFTEGLGWVPAYPTRDVAGFWLPQMYSPTIYPESIVKKFEEAKGNHSKEAIFYQHKIGLGWVAAEGKLTLELLEAAKGREPYPMPSSSKVSAMGVDVGTPFLHVEVSEFPQGIHGFKKVVWAGKCRDFDECARLMHQFNVVACVVDANPERRAAEAFRDKFIGRVFLAFYPNDAKMAKNESWQFATGKVNLHRTFYIDQVVGRYRINSVLLPTDIPDEYLKHHLNVARTDKLDQQGNPVARWINTGEDHFVHAGVYAEAAANYFGGGEPDLLPETPPDDYGGVEELEDLRGEIFF